MHVEGSTARIARQSEGVDEKIVHGGAGSYGKLDLPGSGLQLGVGESAESTFRSSDLLQDGVKGSELVVGHKDAGRYRRCAENVTVADNASSGCSTTKPVSEADK